MVALVFNELLQQYVNKDYEELCRLTGQAGLAVTEACKELAQQMPSVEGSDPETTANYLLTCLVTCTVMADGEVSELERKLLSDVFLLDEENVMVLVNLYSPKLAEGSKLLSSHMNEDDRTDVMMLCTAIAAVDETISKEEVAFLRSLFG